MKTTTCLCGAVLTKINHDEAYYIASHDFWSCMVLLEEISREIQQPSEKDRMEEVSRALQNWFRILQYRKIYQCPDCGRISVSDMDPDSVFNSEKRDFQFLPAGENYPVGVFQPIDLEKITHTPSFRGQLNSKEDLAVDDAEAAADAMVYYSHGAGNDTKTRLKDALAAVQECGPGWHGLEAIKGYLKYVIQPADLERRLDAWVKSGELEKREFSMFLQTEYRLKPKQSTSCLFPPDL